MTHDDSAGEEIQEETVICQTCGEPFSPRSDGQRFCASPACRANGHWRQAKNANFCKQNARKCKVPNERK